MFLVTSFQDLLIQIKISLYEPDTKYFFFSLSNDFYMNEHLGYNIPECIADILDVIM